MSERKRILILCEDKISCPVYLNKLRHEYRPKTRFEIEKGKGGNILGLFKKAEQIYFEYKDTAFEYDEIYCLYDKDRLKGKEERIQYKEVCLIKKKYGFKEIFFDPYFEIWLALHFEKINKISKTELVKKVKKHLYNNDKKIHQEDFKKDKRIFEKTNKQILAAVQNCEELSKSKICPTNFHELIKRIMEE